MRDDIHDRAEWFDLNYTEKTVGSEQVGMLYNDKHVCTFYGLESECEALMRGIARVSEDRYDEWEALIEYPDCEIVIFISECQFYRETQISQIVNGYFYCSYMFTDQEGNILRLR